LTAGFVLVLAGCGEQKPAEGLISNVDKARNAASIAGLETSLVTVALVKAASPEDTAGSLVAALQAKDPTNRYTTAAPTAPGIVQVVGGGAGPVMLVAINSDPSSGREPYFVAAWQGGGSTMYYVGHEPPAYAVVPPAGPGWSASRAQ
jgi:hypothetical protein